MRASQRLCRAFGVLFIAGCGRVSATNDANTDDASLRDVHLDDAVSASDAHDANATDHVAPADVTDGSPDTGVASGLVFDDEFDGPAGSAPDPTRWNVIAADDGQWNHELECYVNARANVQLDGAGHLQLIARSAPGTTCGARTVPYTSGKITTLGHFSHAHGRLEMRAMLPNAHGMWPAFWAMGDNMPGVGWPQCGEIDVMEVIGTTPTTVYGTLHGPRSDGMAWAHGQAHDTMMDVSSAFHTYAATWTDGSVAIQFDGVTYATIDRTTLVAGENWVFDTTGFFLLLNLAVGGDWPGPPNASTTFPQTMTVDYVRVYP